MLWLSMILWVHKTYYDYAWYVKTMIVLWCWIKGYSHEHTIDMMWKVFSHVGESKVWWTFSPNESMR